MKPLLTCLICLLILLSSGCAAAPKNQESTTAQKPVIKLAEREWQGFALNNAVAKILLEEQMGYSVEIIPVEGETQFESLARGETHANLEIWPSNWAEQLAQLQQEERIELNELGVIGKIGWFIPTYVVTQQPQIATWQGLQEPEIAALFSPPDNHSQGYFIEGPSDWIQHNAAIIQALKLPFQVKATPSEEELLAQVEAAYARQEPILFYFWTPHALFAELDLTQVQLPAYREGCFQAKIVDCGYPPEIVLKAFWPGLADYAPPVHQFLQHYSLTNENQITMLAQLEFEGKTVPEAARFWIEQNEVTWQTWLSE